MFQSKVTVDMNYDEIKNYIQKQIDTTIKREKLFVDINDLVQITSCSKGWLEEELLSDVRVRVHERRKNRKRLWLYKETIDAIKEIADEW